MTCLKKQVLYVSMLAFGVGIALCNPVRSEELLVSPQLSDSLAREAVHAIRIGIQWLENNQQPEGYWSNPAFPAVTALAVSAILNGPDQWSAQAMPASASRGLSFILTCVQDDGCIYRNIQGVKGGGMPNYNTALCLMALADAGNPEYLPVIERARACLIQGQYLGEGVFRGGMGYDAQNQRPYADLSNTVTALEALRRTQRLALEKQTPGETQLNWDAAIEFVSRCQNLRATNNAAWVSDATEERGGFVYHPEKSMAGELESDDEQGTYFRSYGSMTYAGLLSFIYARVDAQDPRVQAAVDWITRRWTVDENPGMGLQGLYYNYHTMAKALNAYGQEVLQLPDGQKVAWRPALVQKLVSLQRIDAQSGTGYWQNDNNRWWENDPALVTAYTLLALETAVFGRSPSR